MLALVSCGQDPIATHPKDIAEQRVVMLRVDNADGAPMEGTRVYVLDPRNLGILFKGQTGPDGQMGVQVEQRTHYWIGLTKEHHKAVIDTLFQFAEDEASVFTLHSWVPD